MSHLAVRSGLKEAAGRLGISPDAARKRLELVTLRGEKRAGRSFVYLAWDTAASTDRVATQDTARTPPNATLDTQPAAVRELLEALRDENRFLRVVPESCAEEIRRYDHIIAGLVERAKDLPATVDVSQVHVPGPEQGSRPAHEKEAMKTPAVGTARVGDVGGGASRVLDDLPRPGLVGDPGVNENGHRRREFRADPGSAKKLRRPSGWKDGAVSLG